MQKWLLGLLSGVFMVLSCVAYVEYIPDPVKDIEIWVENLSRQQSFKYRYELKTQAVYTSAQGICVIDRGEHVRGSWFSPDSEVPFEYYGFGDMEYSREQGRWHVMSRGDESDILAQVTRLLEFRTFEYLGLDDTYNYTFKANIPFLVPGRWKEMIGAMQVSTRNYLPLVIWAGLPDSSVYWRIDLFDYNRSRSIDPPVQSWHRYRINLGHEYMKTLKKRMELADIAHRLDRSGENIFLSMPHYYTIDDMQDILRARPVRVYGVTQGKQNAKRVAFLRGDESKPLYLTEVVCSENDFKHADIKFDGASRPYLQLKLRDKYKFTNLVAIEIDSVIAGTAVLDTVKKIDTIIMHSDMSFYELQLLKAYILQPLPEVELKPEGEGVE